MAAASTIEFIDDGGNHTTGPVDTISSIDTNAWHYETTVPVMPGMIVAAIYHYTNDGSLTIDGEPACSFDQNLDLI